MTNVCKKAIEMYDGKRITVIGMNVYGEICHEFDCSGVAHVRVAPCPKNPFFPNTPTETAILTVDSDTPIHYISISTDEEFNNISKRIVVLG